VGGPAAVTGLLDQWIARLADAPWMPASLAHPFLVRAMLVTLLLAPCLGALSPLVVAQRLAFFSSTLGHSALAGLSLGLLLGESLEHPLGGMFGFAILMALGMGWVRNQERLPRDTVVGLFLSFSLGLGLCLLVVVTRQFDIHRIQEVLFGSVVTVGSFDLLVVALVVGVAAAVLLPRLNDLLASSLDATWARSRGVPVRRNEYVLLVTLAVLVVAAIKIVGALLVEALVVVPAATARNLAWNLRSFFAFSMLAAWLAAQGGVWVGTLLPVPSGAAVVLCLSVLYLVSLGLRRLLGGAR